MINSTTEITTQQGVAVRRYGPDEIQARLSTWEAYFANRPTSTIGNHPGWLSVLQRGLKHVPYCLEATRDDGIVGLLPLAYVRSALFGRFLVSLPYLNSSGVMADDDRAATSLIDAAVGLADALDVRYLELRHEIRHEHPALGHAMQSKVHMRLSLPTTTDELWRRFKPKVRNQIRKGEKHNFCVQWGGGELLDDFYEVFCRNMRDLGTPVFGRSLFEATLDQFPNDAELCVERLDKQPVAAALLIHGGSMTEVPSASSLRTFNPTNANMLMYWHLLQRACERGQREFDFGRSTIDSNTFRFKKQWGATPIPAIWQYYLRRGDIGDLRRETGAYQRAINLWKHLPITVTRFIGPKIVRGIP